MTEGELILRIISAGVGGLAVGIQRQASEHAAKASTRFAGARTLTLLGLLGGICGWVAHTGADMPATLLLVCGAAIVVHAYISAIRRRMDGTTEIAALVVLAAGVLAGRGDLAIASGVIAITVLLLVENSRLHRMMHDRSIHEPQVPARTAALAIAILTVAALAVAAAILLF